MRKTWNKHEGDVSIGRFRQQASLWRSAADFNWFLLKMFQKHLRYHCNYKSVLSYKKHQQIKLQTRLVITQVSVDQIKLDSIWHFRVEISSFIDVIDIDLVTARRSIDIFRWGRPGVNILRTKTASDRRVPEHFPFILKIRFHFLVLRYFSDPIRMFSHWYSAAQWGC